MSETPAQAAALDLVWSLWTELGVPGLRRSHQRTILDLERLILVTPMLGRSDARLMDLARAWCTQHHQRISAVRVAGLLKQTQAEVRAAAEHFLGELAGRGVRIANVRPVRPTGARSSRTMSVPLERGALLQLRVRGLVGVSGRADVLVRLLASPESWATAAELEHVGIAKRNVARILAELAEAGIVHSRNRLNAREFRLSNAPALGAVVSLPDKAVFADWRAIFEWMQLAIDLSSIPPDKQASLRVEVARRRRAIESLALTLGLPMMGTRDPGSATDTVAWVVHEARGMADGVTRPVAGTHAPPFTAPTAPGSARTRAPRRPPPP